MKPTRSEPGLAVSAAAHAGLLLATLIAFSGTKTFEAHEAVAVDMVTDAQFNEVMKGEKTAKKVEPIQRAEKIAQTPEARPLPPLAEAKRDISAPPPPAKPRPDDPSDQDEAKLDEARPPPKRLAAPAPPARPEPAKPEPPKAEPAKPQQAKPEPPRKEEPEKAEVVKQKPPEKTKPEKQAEQAPPPPAKPKEKRFEMDAVAKLLEKQKTAEKAPPSKTDSDKKSDKPAAKPKSGDETAKTSKFDAANIAKLLSHEAPQRRAATGAELTKTASLGAPTASAPRMSPTLQAQIDAYTQEHYGRCWRNALSIDAHSYVPQVEFRLTRNGALDGEPRLLNPSANPVERSRAEQAVGAVRRCSPMPIPPAFEPYFDYWRVTVLNMTNDM